MKIVVIDNGTKYGKLTIIREVKQIWFKRMFECECLCWRIKDISIDSLRNWTKSCWCLVIEKNKEKRTHWETKTKFYGIWRWSRERCNNTNSKDYKNYGGRWIRHHWDRYEDFNRDMYESYLEHTKNNDYTSLDRIDVDWHYCKENCRWADRITQQNNRRTI